MATQLIVAVMIERYSLTFSDAVHACVRVFKCRRFPTMSRACVDVSRASSRACVRAWTSYYDAACVRDRFAFVLTCMRAAFVSACVRGRIAFVLTCMRATCPHAWTSRVRAWTSSCIRTVYSSCELFRLLTRSGPLH